VTSAIVSAGSFLKAGANGTVVPFVQGTDTEDRKIGKAHSGAASGGLVDAVLFNV
jgi:hypothetical protein